MKQQRLNCIRAIPRCAGLERPRRSSPTWTVSVLFPQTLNQILNRGERERDYDIFYSTIRPFDHSAIRPLTFDQLIVLEQGEII